MRCGFGLRAGREGRGCGFPGGREVCVSEKKRFFLLKYRYHARCREDTSHIPLGGLLQRGALRLGSPWELPFWWWGECSCLFFSLSLFLTHSGEGLFGTKVRNFEKERSSEWIVNTGIRLFERTCSQHYSGQENAGGGAHRHMQATQLPLPPTKMCGFGSLHSGFGGRPRIEKDIYCGFLEDHCDYHG